MKLTTVGVKPTERLIQTLRRCVNNYLKPLSNCVFTYTSLWVGMGLSPNQRFRYRTACFSHL